jgi:hypothetical protein
LDRMLGSSETADSSWRLRAAQPHFDSPATVLSARPPGATCLKRGAVQSQPQRPENKISSKDDGVRTSARRRHIACEARRECSTRVVIVPRMERRCCAFAASDAA